jgi:alkylation response protein AidB-like acyl-CoA dehydrogenase
VVREQRAEFRRFYDELEQFLREQVDPVVIDETGEYPEDVVDGLPQARRLRHQDPEGVRRPRLHVTEYTTVMQMVGSHDGNIGALLSAHQSIGVPQPLKLFGTPEQKKKYLPRCAAGAISAFALTEPHVGSDPASLSTTAELRGDTFVLNGEKLWCTNGTLAELSSSWRAIRRRRRSAASSSRPAGRASRSSIAAASWASRRSRTAS